MNTTHRQKWLILILLCASSFLSVSGFADHVRDDGIVVRLTQHIVELLEDEGPSAFGLERMLEARREVLERLLDNGKIETFLRVALPHSLVQTLPQESLPYVEEETDQEGTYEFVVGTEPASNESFTSHLLALPDGESIELKFKNNKGPDTLSTGAHIRVHGLKLGQRMALEDPNTSVTVLADGAGTLNGSLAAAGAPSSIKVAVILFNFQNDTSQPITPSSMKGMTFTNSNSVTSYFEEVSFGKVTLGGQVYTDGDVFGWYTIALDKPSSCGTSYSTYGNSWVQAANQAATNDGVNLNGYNILIYKFPFVSGCPAGWATVGGNPAKSWINSSSIGTLTHEVGHNFGTHHASSMSCFDANGQRVPININCNAISEYGDPFNVMGSSSGRRHMTNYNKGQTAGNLNWLDPSNTLTVTTSGTYSLSPIEQSTTGVQSLRIPRTYTYVYSSGGTNYSETVSGFYYLEFRQPLGQYDSFNYSDPAVNGVMIRLAPEYTSVKRSILLDATPATTSFTDAPLALGNSLQDPVSGITIQTTGLTSTDATVDITFGTGICFPANPTVSITPSSQWGFPDEAKTYTLTVSNNNSLTCSPATFDITSALPSGWTQSPAAVGVIVSSGATASQNISVTPPTDTPAGLYEFTETVSYSQNSAYSAPVTANYNVQIPDTASPNVTITNPADGANLPRKGSVSISSSASDASGISRIEIFVDNVSIKVCNNATSCQKNWSMNGVAKGSHIIAVTATDNASPLKNSATKAIMVNKPQ